MVVDADASTGTVTLRVRSALLVGLGTVAGIVGVGAPVLAERHAPGLLVPALLVTVGAAALVLTMLARTVVLDDHGITLGASRRGRRRLSWSEVRSLSTEHGRLVVVTVDGRRVRGPRCDARLLVRAHEDAAVLGLLPPGRDLLSDPVRG